MDTFHSPAEYRTGFELASNLGSIQKVESLSHSEIMRFQMSNFMCLIIWCRFVIVLSCDAHINGLAYCLLGLSFEALGLGLGLRALCFPLRNTDVIVPLLVDDKVLLRYNQASSLVC